MPHGIPDSQWTEAKAQALGILAARARDKKTIYYSELASQLTKADFEARDPKLFRLLEELSHDEHRAGRGLISALVVHKADDQPGKGYYSLAKSLGRDTEDELGCWANEVQRLYTDWAKS